MKAMIFAAGLGSRLGELTKDTPKCLMPLGKVTILEHVIGRLKDAGVTSATINVHHCADQVISFVESRGDFGISINFSREENLLDTGGGLKKVASFFKDERAFIVHNADVFSSIDLTELVKSHLSRGAIGTLAVLKRESTRGLYLSSDLRLVGWTEEKSSSYPPANSALFGFCGVSVASGELFQHMQNDEAFSLIDPYLRAARSTGRVWGVPVPDSTWIDIGKPEHLAVATAKLADTEK